VAYSSRVRCAGLPERRYFDTTDSSVVGIVGIQRRRRLLHCSVRTNRQRKLRILPMGEKFGPCQPAAGEPASRLVGERGECAAEIGTQNCLGNATLGPRVAQSSQVQCTT
jgi:hypothetical protein